MDTGEYNHLAWLWDNAASADEDVSKHVDHCPACESRPCEIAIQLASSVSYWEGLAVAEESK